VERWREITVDGICDMGDIPIKRTVDALSNQLVTTLDGLLDPGNRDREPAYRGLPNFKRDFIFDVVHSARNISCQILENFSDKFRVTRAPADNYEVLGTCHVRLRIGDALSYGLRVQDDDRRYRVYTTEFYVFGLIFSFFFSQRVKT
jgi:hypothetical protein